MATVNQILEHINGEVAKLSANSTNDLADVLASAEKELTHDLANWKMLGKGDERFTVQVYRNALAQIQGTLHSIRKNIPGKLINHLEEQGRKAAELATKHLITEVEGFSKIYEGSVRPVAIEAASVLASGEKAVWKKFSNSAERYAGQVGKDIQKQLAIGVVRGETVDQLTARLIKMGGPKGWVAPKGSEMSGTGRAKLMTDGLFKKYNYYAERLVRTEVVSAYNSFAMDGMAELEEDDPGYFKRWDAAIDGRTCVVCASYDDLVVKLDGKFPQGLEYPPAHPNCRCCHVVWRKEWTEASHRDHAGKNDGTIDQALEGKHRGQEIAEKHLPHVSFKNTPTPTLPPEIKKETQKQDKSDAVGKKKSAKADPKPKPPETVKSPEPEAKPKKEPKPKKVPAELPKADPNLQPITGYPLDMEKAYTKKQENFFKKLDKDETEGIKDYQGEGYTNINSHLRAPSPGDSEWKKENLNNTIANIDRALNKSTLQEDGLYYRGTRVNLAKKLKPGSIFQDRGYVSVSENPYVAESFSSDRGTIFHIEVPKGTKGGHISHTSYEQEILLERGTKIQIISLKPELNHRGIETGRTVARARIIK